jgi:Flp pilus assembly pilin Flp
MSDRHRASVPLQYALVAAVAAMAAVTILETANKKVVEKLNAVSSALNKIQF